MIRLVSSVIVLMMLMMFVVADDQHIVRRSSNLHRFYSSYNNQNNKQDDPFAPDVNFFSVVGHDGARHRDLIDQSDQTDGSTTYQRQAPDWTGHANPYVKKAEDNQDGSTYRYPQPESKSLENVESYNGVGYGSQYQAIQPKEYGYGSAPTKSKSKGKDKDLLWQIVDHFFGKKKDLEDQIWDLILQKGQKGGHGEPPGGYHHDDKLSKEEIFKKVKLLAIAATVLLILLGSGIVAAPLVIGKGRRRALNLPSNVVLPSASDIGQLAGDVLRAVQYYHQQQTPQQQASVSNNS